MLNSVCFPVSHGPLFKGLSLFFLPHSSRAKAPQCLLTFDCSEIVPLSLRWTYGVINQSKTGKKSYRLSSIFLLLLPVLTGHPIFIIFRLFQLNLKGFVCLYLISSWLFYGGCSYPMIDRWQTKCNVKTTCISSREELMGKAKASLLKQTEQSESEPSEWISCFDLYNAFQVIRLKPQYVHFITVS